MDAETFIANIRPREQVPARTGIWQSPATGAVGLLMLRDEWLRADSGNALWPPSNAYFISHPVSNGNGDSMLLAVATDPTAPGPRLKTRQWLLYGKARQPQPYSTFTAVGPNHLAILAAEDDVAPGLDSPYLFQFFGLPYINRSGTMAFQSTYVEAPDPARLRQPHQGTAIWRGRSAATLVPIAREGMGIDAGGTPTTLASIEAAPLLYLDRAIGATEGGRYTRFSDTGAMLFRGKTALRDQTAIMLAGIGDSTGGGSTGIKWLPALVDVLLENN